MGGGVQHGAYFKPISFSANDGEQGWEAVCDASWEPAGAGQHAELKTLGKRSEKQRQGGEILEL